MLSNFLVCAAAAALVLTQAGLKADAAFLNPSVCPRKAVVHRTKTDDKFPSLVSLRSHGHNEVDTTTRTSDVSSFSAVSSRRDWFRKTASAAAALTGWGGLTVQGSSAQSNPTTLVAPSSSSSTAVSPPPVTSSSVCPGLCDPSVSTFRNPLTGRVVHLIGTAHISSDSAILAAEVVKDVKPDGVFVELDAKRVGRALPSPDSGMKFVAPTGIPPTGGGSGVTMASLTADTTLGAVSSSMPVREQQPLPPREQQPIQEGRTSPFDLRAKAMRAGSMMVGNAIKGLYKKLENEGFNAGGEFIVAVKEGLNAGSTIILGDRDVEVTLQRLTEALSKTDLKKLLASDSELEQKMDSILPANLRSDAILANSPDGSFDKESLATYVETVKAKQNVQMIMATLKDAAPELYNAMVAERDAYMATGLDKLNDFGTIVAVMGIAHVDGVERNLRDRGWKDVNVPCSSKP